MVTTPGGTGTGAALYTYVTPAPTVTSLGPSSGPAVGGTIVTITGANLSGTTAVMFGGVPATSFTIVNSTTITAISPARAAGPVDVVITTPGGNLDRDALFTFMLQTSATSTSPRQTQVRLGRR